MNDKRSNYDVARVRPGLPGRFAPAAHRNLGHASLQLSPRVSFAVRFSPFVILCALATSNAQTGNGYDLTWNTIDSGGQMFSTGNGYELGGTIGQADAGTLSGGSYSLQGGFWPASIPAADPGCGPCRLYCDLEPFFCVIDIGDLIDVLAAYSEPTACTTPTAVGITPGSLIYDGSCPVSCTSNGDCTGALGQNCVNGQCCDLCDISEVIEVLDMFADPTTANCPHTCAPGACELGAPNNCCRDGSYFTGNDDNGTTQSDCSDLGGTYLGDNTTCAGSMLPICP